MDTTGIVPTADMPTDGGIAGNTARVDIERRGSALLRCGQRQRCPWVPEQKEPASSGRSWAPLEAGHRSAMRISPTPIPAIVEVRANNRSQGADASKRNQAEQRSAANSYGKVGPTLVPSRTEFSKQSRQLLTSSGSLAMLAAMRLASALSSFANWMSRHFAPYARRCFRR